MSGRKRTKRKNSDDDFDVDEGDDGMDNDDINKWACHSCTFMNRAAAFRCFVCGTRKGTSTRRSRCNDNVVEMQKTITDMVQKQVEKEKSLKRRERSMLKSVTRETSEGIMPKEVKIEEPDVAVEKPKTPVPQDPEPETSVVMTPPKQVPTKLKSKSPPPATPVSKKSIEEKEKKPAVIDNKSQPIPTEPSPSVNGAKDIVLNQEAKKPISFPTTIKTEKIDASIPMISCPSTSTGIPRQNTLPAAKIPPSTPITIPQHVPASIAGPSTSSPTVQAATVTRPSEESILHHLPERVVKKLNHPLPFDYDLLKAHKMITGIDPIVAESEAVLLPQDWDRQKVMKGLTSSLGSNATESPTTSRQSSETDSSSSDGNRSFETPLNDSFPFASKSCQIPDYMIHRDSPQKIFIVANGYPAYFEEFPRRIQQ